MQTGAKCDWPLSCLLSANGYKGKAACLLSSWPAAHAPMASVLAIEDGDSTSVENEAELRSALVEALRVGDEAIVMPGASRSTSSLSFKNVVMTLDGAAPNAPFRAFSSDWGHGVSVVRVPTEAAERVLSTPEHRRNALRALVRAIPNELAGGGDVGPALDSLDARDVPNDAWTAGFDGGNCCCGLYSATELRPTTGAPAGMTRAHKSYFLLAKAGAGRAAQQFHQRLGGFAASGQSLDAIFSNNTGMLGDAHIQRVASAGRRNRGRLILAAAEVLGLAADVDSVPDHACCPEAAKPTAILMTDSVSNMLERLATSNGLDNAAWRYYAGAVATTASQGAVSCSSAMEGFVLFFSPEITGGNTGTALRVHNVCHGAIPFSSRRVSSTRDALMTAVAAHRKCALEQPNDDKAVAHPDSEWVQNRFGWKTAAVRRMRETDTNVTINAAAVEPPQLWGTHAPLEATAWTLQLGMRGFRAVVLSPEIVALAGAEPSVLRASVGTRA